MQPTGMKQAQFNAAKSDLVMMLNGQCETCGSVTARPNVSYLGDFTQPFDPDHLICRCQSCVRNKRTEPVKIILAGYDTA